MILKCIEILFLTRTNSASSPLTYGTSTFKYGLVVSTTLSALGIKGLQCGVLGKEVVDISSLFFYFSDYLSYPPPLYKVKTFISKLLKVFHQYFIVPYRDFYFTNIFLDFINIHPLDLIFRNSNMHWRG